MKKRVIFVTLILIWLLVQTGLSFQERNSRNSKNHSLHFTTVDSPPVKLVNKRTILIWDIPATNGLIHIIEGPLKAPPVIVTPLTPSTVYSQSNASTVTAILIVIFIGGVIAGVAYYFLKHKNDGFRFQYFKNDDEDGASTKTSANPVIVSIPNPLYSGYRAFTEPFGEGEQCESPASVAANPPNLLE